MVAGISLANKCQLLFGCAVLLILTAALSVPWVRTRLMIEDYQIELARQLADAWISDRIQLGTLTPGVMETDFLEAGSAAEDGSVRFRQPTLQLTLVWANEFDEMTSEDEFLSSAFKQFRERPDDQEYAATVMVGGEKVYRYARAIQETEIRMLRDDAATVFSGPLIEPLLSNPLRAVLVVDRTTQFAESQLLRSQIYIVAAGIAGTLGAIGVFYLILTQLIFSPVRKLRETAETVQEGNLKVRSDIETGDEFEQLAEAFNTMLDQVVDSQTQLREINASLDLKVDELAEANIGLYEANRLKGEFLASVSHELRTPLNSIIGFAEVLLDLAKSDEQAEVKRIRYLENILTSGRTLLEMINELLDMAKIEAGRMEVHVEQTSISDVVEGLIRILRPQADTKALDLEASVSERLPLLETDPGKLQQILYNFLSNAIKFTPRQGLISITAERVTRQDQSMGVRIAVTDSGPGIPEDMQDVIFEKFRQIDASHTREHQGTGLGLAICRELAEMLGATVSYASEPGRGATFFVDLPLVYQPLKPRPLMDDDDG